MCHKGALVEQLLSLLTYVCFSTKIAQLFLFFLCGVDELPHFLCNTILQKRHKKTPFNANFTLKGAIFITQILCLILIVYHLVNDFANFLNLRHKPHRQIE